MSEKKRARLSPSDVQRTFNQSALQQAWNRAHQEKPASQQPEAEIVAFAGFLRKKVPWGASVLDVGCGRGRNTLPLSRTGFQVYGCDLSPVAVKLAKARAEQVGTPAHLQVADLTSLPYPSDRFAAAVCVHVLPYHLKADIARGVRELRRVLEPEGWLYLDLLDCDDAEYGCGQRLEDHTFFDPESVPIHFSSRQEIDELLQGFAVEQVTRIELGSGPHPRVAWVVWAMKTGCRVA